MTTFRQTPDIANDLIDGALDTGGATVPAVVGSRPPIDGYIVAVKGHEHRIADGLFGKPVKAYVAEHVKYVSDGRYFGSWIDDDNYLVLDVVEYFAERAPAVAAGRERGEECIYDVARGETIATR